MAELDRPGGMGRPRLSAALLSPEQRAKRGIVDRSGIPETTARVSATRYSTLSNRPTVEEIAHAANAPVEEIGKALLEAGCMALSPDGPETRFDRFDAIAFLTARDGTPR